MDLAIFRKIVYDISKQLDIDVIGFTEPRVTPNFYVAEIKYQHEKLYLLASYDNNWAFSSEYNPLECQLSYINNPKLAAAIQSQNGIRVLTKEELLSPFEVKTYLSESDIKYWQPQTLGEGLFNWWD